MSDERAPGQDEPRDVDDRILDSLEDADAAREAYEALLARAGEQAVEPRLDATRRAVELLGDPQRAYRVIHITGTNGKGSTARVVDALLRAHGLRTGLLTSPALERVHERIQIDGEPVSDAAFAAGYADVAPFLDMVDAELESAGERRLTFFEALTVLALAIFADAPVDVVVLEVGMGGTWDSTNVADGDVAVITPIALDHTNRLGTSIEAIAREKAGIIKPGAIVVSAEQQPEALAVLEARADEVGARMLVAGRDFSLASQQVAVGGQLIGVRGLAAEYLDQLVPLMGSHQGHNAMLAIVAVEAFLGGGAQPLTAEVLAAGLQAATSPGRLDVVGAHPLVILDAAHNPHGAASLRAALGEYFGLERVTLVLGILVGKDARGVLAELEPVVDEVVVTQSTSERALDADELAAIAVEVLGAERVLVEPDLGTAIEAAREAATDRDGAVVVTGSITLLGDALGHAREAGWLRRPDAASQAATIEITEEGA